jgi:O-antigen chain-terminating methyltransferase
MDPKGEELAAVIAEIRQRVRARHPNGTVSGDLTLPDLMPLLRARDAAEAKVASIGTVNPRPPGLLNSTVQSVKRLVARALDWHVREQVEFNRAVMACVQATLEALAECNRALASLGALREEVGQIKDLRTHWIEWRAGWEQRLTATEIQFLRSVAELQASVQHRVALVDANFRGQVKQQHADYEAALNRATEDIQKRLWADLVKIRADYEALIHTELRLLRQRASLARTVEHAVQSAPTQWSGIDWLRFAERFRGSEESVRERQGIYASRFREHAPVLDLGCGRGELLEVLRAAGISARGIDANDDSIALCRSKGLDVEQDDVFNYLASLSDSSLHGVVCCQVVEHLPPERLPELLRTLHAKMRAGALIAIETPNPECLAIFATHFYLDPTHRHPIPPALLSFYLEEAGFGRLEMERLFPALETMPSVSQLPEAFRDAFFGGLDYVIFAAKLG